MLNPAKKDSTWKKFSKSIDYRKVATTKPHAAHPNFICEYNSDFYVTRFEQKDVIKINFFETISHIIADKKEIEIKKKAMSEFSEKNTWENNNKLIIKTIYEN